MPAASAHDRPPVFRFSPNAYDLGLFEECEGICEACGNSRGLRYTSSIYAIETPEFICPWCVADGTAAQVFDGQFSDYFGIDGVPVKASAPAEVNVAEAIEVATRTPSYFSWQQQEWRSHCGRPCSFLGDIGADELITFLDEPAFAADVDGGLGWDGTLLRSRLRAGGDLAGYLFRCLTCGSHRLHVDAS